MLGQRQGLAIILALPGRDRIPAGAQVLPGSESEFVVVPAPFSQAAGIEGTIPFDGRADA